MTAAEPVRLAQALAESDRLRDLLDEATRATLNLASRPAEIKLAREIRQRAGLDAQ